MRNQPLVLRIKVNQKGLSGLTTGSVTQLAETLAHEYSLHAEAQLAAIKALRDRSLSNKDALKAIVTSANDHGGFNNADAQHAQLTNKKGDRYDAMVAVINEMKKNLTATDAAALQTVFEEDARDRH
jgi:Spy/CpxP family protein refolding chaperone